MSGNRINEIISTSLEKIKERDVAYASCLATRRLVELSLSLPMIERYFAAGIKTTSSAVFVSITGERRTFLFPHS